MAAQRTQFGSGPTAPTAEEPGGSAATGSGEVPPAVAGETATTTPAAGTHGAPTRRSAAWGGVVAGLVCLIVVLVFILQNLHSVRVHFFWADWNIPLAVDLLLAAVLGGVIVAAVGAMRILELRRTARRNARR